MKAAIFGGLVFGLAASAYPRLPLPEPNIPEMPPLAPTVVTAGGQLRFLSEFPDARLSWNGKSFSGNLRGGKLLLKSSLLLDVARDKKNNFFHFPPLRGGGKSDIIISVFYERL